MRRPTPIQRCALLGFHDTAVDPDLIDPEKTIDLERKIKVIQHEQRCSRREALEQLLYPALDRKARS